MDRIEIRGVRAFGRHGVLASERLHGQTFVVDLALELDLTAAARSDALHDTVHYGVMAERVVQAVETTRFDLIEALAAHLADIVLTEVAVAAVTVRVAKPDAPMSVPVDDVAVVLRRTRETP